MKLPRNAQIWLPGYWRSRRREGPPAERVWLVVGDHYEPLWGGASVETGRARVAAWRREWPKIAGRHRDGRGRPACYTFFYPEEEYRPELMEPLAEMTRQGYGDVEIHLHHDGEGEENFVERIARFKRWLRDGHGLLHESGGETVFGFIHGNWALDNSRGGRFCGLNNEITLLRRLGCYADFTLPSAPYATQTRSVNEIYWATDDPARAKSHDTGLAVTAGGGIHGDLLMVPGPLALNWRERKAGLIPRIEVGELAWHNPPTAGRVRLWLDYAPRIGGDVFVKLFAHGAPEKQAKALLGGGLDAALRLMAEQCRAARVELRFSSAWEAARRIRELAEVKQPASRASGVMA